MESKIFAEAAASASERLAAAEVEKPDAGDPRAAIADAYNLQPSTYNFWTPEAYRKTYVRRFELGRGSTDAFAVLLNERCAIEKQVSDYYRQWSSKVVTAINTCTSSARLALAVTLFVCWLLLVHCILQVCYHFTCHVAIHIHSCNSM